MYLDRIEMQGFKSFADKTVIHFDRGITAVVGPNGSGKSNLSEAIRWVLGEQSAKSLRGSKMEDVIFNGTQDRKPVNLARVTLVLNNEDRYLDYDFDEIQISRSYNRNGDSSYSINKQTVRLKDVVDLLLDSGLGKNSFSMISQGQVEQIFLNKPEERRAIFEEAAGVQKYQYRKHEASLKLDRSNDHLSRVKDIIHELEGQLAPLKQQREAALVYQEKSQLLRQMEITLYTQQLDAYQAQWQTVKDQVQEGQSKQADFEQQLDGLQAQSQTLASQEEATETAINQLVEDRQSQGQLHERLLGRVQVLEQEIAYGTSSQAERLASNQANEAQLQEAQTQLSQLQADYQEKLKTQQDLDQDLASYRDQKASMADLSPDRVEDLRNLLIDHYQAQATANNQIQQVQRLADQAQARQETILASQDQVDQEVIAAQAQVQAKRQAFEAQQAELDQDLKAIEQFQARLQDLGQQREELQQAYYQLEGRLQSDRNQLANLEQMQENYSGYYAGVQAVMKAKLDGVEGTVAESIRVEDGYQKAIETALGASLQHIIVRDDQAARTAIDYLKRHRAGRATFLPRTNIKARYLDASVLSQINQSPGFIGLATEVVKADEANLAIVANLLGTTLISQDLPQAQTLARQLNYRFKIVTLAGDVLFPGGSLTGGAQRRESSMLNQQAEIDRLKQAIQDQETRRQANQALQAEIQQQMDQARTDLDRLSSQQQAGDQAGQALYQALQEADQHHQSLLNRQLINQDEVQQLSQDQEDYQSQLVGYQADLAQAQASIDQVSQEINLFTLNEAEVKQALDQLDAKLAELQTQTAVSQLELRQIQADIQMKEEQIKSLDLAIANYHSQQTDQSLSLSESQAELTQTQEAISQAKAELDRLDQELVAQRAQRDQIRLDRQALDQEVKQVQADANQLFQDLAKLEAQEDRLASQIDSHLDYLNQEYQLSYEAASQEQASLDPVEADVDQVRQLKREINRLGPINLQSIEDYEEIDGRYQALVAQEEDLLTAIGQLQETIKEMDSEVINRFGSTFKEIDRHFQATFRQLFGGGNAQLQLTDPEDLLTTGIEIIAQPPGKKRQNLALLSGGERALTAIALLFAILKVRPTPFVVLDEVEAALDDANVYRYGEYLKTFSHETQFIVITHRKGTMEAADVLYGVTMQQSGVSSLASVRLSDADQLGLD